MGRSFSLVSIDRSSISHTVHSERIWPTKVLERCILTSTLQILPLPTRPSFVATMPESFPDLKHEFSRLESQMFDRPKRPGLAPLTPVLPDANDRIHTPGYAYNPVHTEIYGTYRACAKRSL